MATSITVHGVELQAREGDKYVAATAACKAAGRKWSHYWENKGTQDFIQALAESTGLPVDSLVQMKSGRGGGTWIHPHVLIHFASWVSGGFSVLVTGWAARLLSGETVTLTDGERAHAIKVAKGAVSEPVRDFGAACDDALLGTLKALEAMRREQLAIIARVAALEAARQLPAPYLNDSQRALCAAEEWAASSDTLTQTRAAAIHNVHRSSVQRAARVLRLAPELIPSVRSGELDVYTASRLARMPAHTRRRLANLGGV